MRKRSKSVLSLPLEKRAEIAFKIAVAKAIDEHARLGLPVFVWQDGKIIKLSSKEVQSIRANPVVGKSPLTRKVRD